MGIKMPLRIDDEFPNFDVKTSQGDLNFHTWMGEHYAVLFSHPKDFTPVCTTEFGEVAKLSQKFAMRGVKVMGISVDGLDEHDGWIKDIEVTSGAKVDFPIIADTDLRVSKLLDMLPGGRLGKAMKEPKDSATVRTVFIVGPDKRLRLMMAYPMAVGRNFDEIIRALDAIMISDGAAVATPANWRPGDDVIIPPTIGDEEARQHYGEFEPVLPYLRKIPFNRLM